MNEEQRQVLEYLNANAQGFNNKKTSDEIREALNLPEERTNEHTRELIRKLILHHNVVIGSNSKGYWIIQTEEELNEVINSLNSRAKEIFERATALQQNWDNKKSSK